jgi:hypothetical protein
MLGCVLVVGLLAALSLHWAQAAAHEQAVRLAAETWRWQVGCFLAVGLGVAVCLWGGTAHRHEGEEEHLRARREAAWVRHEQALRAAEEASRRAEEAARRAAAEAWVRDRPAREAREAREAHAQALQAAAQEAYKCDRPAREARERALQAAAQEAYERDRPAREARARAQQAAEREAYERDRPAREARARAQQAAEREAYERDRLAREARARAQQAAEREAYKRERLAREARARDQQAAQREVLKWRKLQTPIGAACPSSSPTDPNNARRQQGFFECRECHAEWRSNDCWRGVKQVCPDGCWCAIPPYQWAALDRNDDGRAQRGWLYTGADRSFGRFKCECGRPWQSAHAWAGETQECDLCHCLVEPFWQEALARSAARSYMDATDRRHNTEGCSKCQKVKPQVCYNLPAATAPAAGVGAAQGKSR